jgi:hypothetical protein
LPQQWPTLDSYSTLAELARSWPRADLLSDLVRVSLRDVRLALANNPALPEQAALKLAGDRSVEVRTALARNHGVSPATARVLANDAESQVREALFAEVTGADKYPWPPEFVQDDDEAVGELLEQGASDVSPPVRRLVAAYGRTASSLLTRLAGDHEMAVRGAVARNSATPEKSLRQLAADSDEEVVAQAAANPLLPDDLLNVLATSANARVRSGLAGNPTSSPERVGTFLSDTDPVVQSAAARNPRAPLGLLTNLLSSLPQNPPSHKGPRMPYAPIGSVRDYVEDAIARQLLRAHDVHCTCGGRIDRSSHQWVSPEGKSEHFLKLRCLGDCGRDWHLASA